MEIAEHIEVLEQEAQLFAKGARVAAMEAEVVYCPGWNVRDLVRHLSEIHLWAAARVARRTTKLFPDDISELTESWPDLAVFWPEDDRLVDWYLETNANLVDALKSASPDDDMPTFLPAPSPLAMWARRQAHETAVHRFDAEFAAGIESIFDPEFASDGIDEILRAFAPRKDEFPTETVRRMAIHADDTGDRWLLTMAPDGVTTVRGDGLADARLSGLATDVYLALWNRREDEAISIEGDDELLRLWRENHRVRWSS